MKYAAALLLALAIAGPSQAQVAELLGPSVVRIKVSRGKLTGYGTGTVVGATSEYLFVLTNAHVVEGFSPTVEFWHNGKVYAVDRCPISWSKRTNNPDAPDYLDAALVAVPRKNLKCPAPPPIGVATLAYRIDQNGPIYTYGCSLGCWPSLMEGRLEGIDGPAITFDPMPARGRSGSGIFQMGREGKPVLIGLLWGRSDGATDYDAKTEAGFGYAISHTLLMEAFNQTDRVNIRKHNRLSTFQEDTQLLRRRQRQRREREREPGAIPRNQVDPPTPEVEPAAPPAEIFTNPVRRPYVRRYALYAVVIGGIGTLGYFAYRKYKAPKVA